MCRIGGVENHKIFDVYHYVMERLYKAISLMYTDTDIILLLSIYVYLLLLLF